MPKIRYKITVKLYNDVKIVKKELSKLGAFQISSGSTKKNEHYILFSVKDLSLASKMKILYPNLLEIN